MKRTKYIFVVGGVMSGVGKGVASASIGKILQWHGLNVTSVKIDPYVNVDAGTMNPIEHGEVFVLSDGTECDQDMGNYERFLDRSLSKTNYLTTGSVYLSVIQKERSLAYGGKCVSVVPHIPLEVLAKIRRAGEVNRADVVITEIGGTVGEYENLIYLEAVRILRSAHPKDVLIVLVSYLPYQGPGSELKTKPTQHAVRAINSAGLQPDIILGRAPHPLDKRRKEKLAFMCNLREEDIISAPNVESIYEVPLNFERDNLGRIITQKLGLKRKGAGRDGHAQWLRLVKRIRAPRGTVSVGIVGKYFSTGDFVLSDAYISVIEAIKHAAYSFGRQPVIHWLNAEEYDSSVVGKQATRNLAALRAYGGIIVPGGFGERGVEGKINAIRFCRTHGVPCFGLCYGMQLMTVEYARNMCGMKGAHTTEVAPRTPYPVIDVLGEQKQNLEESNYGGSMRLGSYPARLKPGTLARGAYGTAAISERHRHRYEVNPKYIARLEEKGLVFSGASPTKPLMEIAELPRSKHPFFLGTQFHPELQSYPLHPHPLFREFIRAAMKRRGKQ